MEHMTGLLQWEDIEVPHNNGTENGVEVQEPIEEIDQAWELTKPYWAEALLGLALLSKTSTR